MRQETFIKNRENGKKQEEIAVVMYLAMRVKFSGRWKPKLVLGTTMLNPYISAIIAREWKWGIKEKHESNLN